MNFAKTVFCFWLIYFLFNPVPVSASEPDAQHASLLLKQKKYRAALEVLEKLESQNPSDLEIKQKIVGAQIGAGEPDSAEIKIQEMLILNPEDYKAQYILAGLYLRKGKFQEAQKLFSRVAEHNPKSPLARKAEKQVSLLRKYQKVSSPDVMPLSAFLATDAARAFSKKDWPSALKGFDGLLNQYPSDPLIQRFRGMALFRMKRYGEAEEVFQRILVRDPKNVPAHFNLGQTLLEQGQKTRAQKEFNWVKAYDKTGGRFYARQIPKMNIRFSAPVKPWNLTVTSGYEFDSNAIFKSSDPFYNTPGDKNSSRFPLTASVNYKFFKTKKWTFAADGFYAQKLYTDFQRLNTYIPGGGISAVYASSLFNRPSYLNIREGAAYTALKNKFYAFSNNISISWIYDWKPRFRLQTYYRWYANEYADDGEDPGLTERDGLDHLAGVSNTYYWNAVRTCYTSAGYDFEFHNTKGENFVQNTHGVKLRQHFPIRWKIEGDVVFIASDSYYPKYGYADPSRRDMTFYLTPGLSRKFFKNTTLFLTYTYENTRGKNNAYEYVRNLFSVQVQYRY